DTQPWSFRAHFRIQRLDEVSGCHGAGNHDTTLCGGVGISRDRRRSSDTDRYGAVESIQLEEEAGGAPEPAPECRSQGRIGLSSGLPGLSRSPSADVLVGRTSCSARVPWTRLRRATADPGRADYRGVGRGPGVRPPVVINLFRAGPE